jgi:hypothetical protein
VVSVVPKTGAITVKLPVIFTPKMAGSQMKFSTEISLRWRDVEFNAKTPRRKDAGKTRYCFASLRLCALALEFDRLKSNASGAQPSASAGNGLEKSQRDFINQPGVDAQRLRRVMIQNNFYPAGVPSVLTGADATRSG